MVQNDNETTQFRMGVAEWRGSVTQSLLDIKENQKEMKADVKLMNTCIAKLKIRVTLISGIIAFAATCLINLVISWMTK